MATKTRAKNVQRDRTAEEPNDKPTAPNVRPSLAERGLVRVSFDVPIEEAELLEDTARQSRFNKTTTFVRALRLLAELDRHARLGGQIVLIDADGSKERLRIL